MSAPSDLAGPSSTTATARWCRSSSAGWPTSCWRCCTAPRTALDAVRRLHRALVRSLGRAGLLRVCVPAACGGCVSSSTCSLALGREVLARAGPGHADFALAMQGPGQRAGHAVRQRGAAAAPAARRPRGASSRPSRSPEPDAGSDVAAMSTTATRLPGGGWRPGRHQDLISNAGTADHYVVFARSGEAGARGIRPSWSTRARRGWTPASASRHRPAPAGHRAPD